MARVVGPTSPLRAHPRQTISDPIDSKVAKLKGRTRGEDISVGGMSLVVPRPVAVGDRMELDLALPDGRSCRLVGEVCRVQDVAEKNRARVGLRWGKLTRQQMDVVTCYFDRLRKQSGE